MSCTHGRRPLFSRVSSIALSLVLVAGCVLVTVPAGAQSPPSRFPEPSVYPISWELKFKHSEPKRIVVRAPGDVAAKAYWYVTYTVTNLGEESVEFDPVFEMLAEDGKTYRANRAVPGEVFEAIKKKEGIRLLEAPSKIIGNIKPGAEQARDGVAIWPEPPVKDMGTFSIFVAGLSGETLIMKKVGAQYVPVNRANAAEELKDVKEEDRLLLRKQYQITYKVLGDDVQPGVDPIEKKHWKWVMR